MSKYLKRSIIFFSIALLAIFLAQSAANYFFSPNQFKPMLAEKLSKQLKRPIALSGDLSWTIFPRLGIKAHRLHLQEMQSSKENISIDIKHAKATIQWFPLFWGKIRPQRISMDGVIHLDKNDHRYFIKQFAFDANQIQFDHEFPLSLNFMAMTEKSTTKLYVALVGNINFHRQDKICEINHLILKTFTAGDRPPLKSSINTNILIDLNKQTASLDNIDAHIADALFMGNINIANFKHPEIDGNIKIYPMDFKNWMNILGVPIKNLHAANQMQGDIHFNIQQNNINVKNNLTLDEIKYDKIVFHNVKLVSNLHDKILEIEPLNAEINNGILTAKTKIDFNTPNPILEIQAQLSSISLENLLQQNDNDNKRLKITGMVDANLQLTSQGKKSKELLENLQGNVNFTIRKGTFAGYHLKPFFKNSNQPEINFDSLGATFNIKQKIINNTDLLLNTSYFTTHGSGQIDLSKKQIHYLLKTNSNEKFALAPMINFEGELKRITVLVDSKPVIFDKTL